MDILDNTASNKTYRELNSALQSVTFQVSFWTIRQVETEEWFGSSSFPNNLLVLAISVRLPVKGIFYGKIRYSITKNTF